MVYPLTADKPKYLPIMLNTSESRVVIIGGGEAAYKKAVTIAPFCDTIVAIADEFVPDFSKLNIELVKLRVERVEQLDGYLRRENIVIIATDNQKLSDQIARECALRGILFNRVDDNRSLFIFPAVFECKGVVLSISTCGRSPALSKFIRDKLKDEVEQYSKALPVVERLRWIIKNMEMRANYFEDLFHDKEFWRLISENKFEEAYQYGLKKIQHNPSS